MKKIMIGLTIVFAILTYFLSTSPLFSQDEVTDAVIISRVIDALHQDPRVDASEIVVSSRDGVVTLSGCVDNVTARKYAELEAKKINSVVGVINMITVEPSNRSDEAISEAVRRRILNSAVVESEDLKVTCVGGKVALSGKVGTWSEGEEACLLAGEVRGVKEIENKLWSESESKRSDQEIEKDALATLERDAYLSGMAFTVSVKNGFVSIEGSVSNIYEKERAGNKILWLTGVKGIENKLKIDRAKNHGVRRMEFWPSHYGLEKAVRAELDQDTRVEASNISIKACFGYVILEGSVTDEQQKRIAEEDTLDVVGVDWVTNNLQVHTD